MSDVGCDCGKKRDKPHILWVTNWHNWPWCTLDPSMEDVKDAMRQREKEAQAEAEAEG